MSLETDEKTRVDITSVLCYTCILHKLLAQCEKNQNVDALIHA